MTPFSLVSEALSLLGLHAALFELPFYNFEQCKHCFPCIAYFA